MSRATEFVIVQTAEERAARISWYADWIEQLGDQSGIREDILAAAEEAGR